MQSTVTAQERLGLLVAFSFLVSTANAQVRTWDGGGGNNLWTNELNWSDDDVPDSSAEGVLVDGNSSSTAAVVFTMPAGATVSVGDLTVDAGDAVTINKVTLDGSSSASFTVDGALDNGGLLTTGGSTGSAKTHGNNFSVTVVGGVGATFNRAGASVYAKSLTGYRRTTSNFYLPAAVTNDGDLYVQCLTGEGGGIMRFRLTGEDSVTFVNNGQILVEGRGYNSGGNQPWCVLGPGTTNQVLTLGGTGTVVLASGLASRSDSYAILTGHTPGCSVTNGAAHTVRGSGYLGRGGSNGTSTGSTSVQSLALLANVGLILGEASSSVSNLTIAASGGSVANLSGARIVSSTPGTQVWIGSHTTVGTFQNDGMLEARDSTSVVFATNLVTTLNGTIRGGGTFVGSPTVTLAAATLEPGDSENANGTGASTVGTLTVDGNLVLSSSTTLSVQLGHRATPGTDYDTVAVTGNLTLDGTLEVETLAGFGPGTYRLFTCAPGGLTDLGLATVAGATVVADVEEGTVDLVVANPATLLLLR